jgi:hypothetical protein
MNKEIYKCIVLTVIAWELYLIDHKSIQPYTMKDLMAETNEVDWARVAVTKNLGN